MAATNPKYRLLQPAAFHVRTDTEWQETFQVLTFPEKWKERLLPLLSRDEDTDQRSIPIWSLNAALVALVPDIVTAATKATINENAPWLYSSTIVDTTALFTIITAWIRTLSPDPNLIEQALTHLTADDLAWNRTPVDFTELVTNMPAPNHSADGTLFQLLPHVIAGKLTAPGVVHQHIMRNDPDELVQNSSQFLRCPTERGAEVMSWTPHGLPKRPFSFFLKITAELQPFSTEPMVHITPGVRRWCHKPNPLLSAERGHTVYMLPSVPWLPGISTSRSFLAATINSRITTDGGERTYTAGWNSRLDRILTELGCMERMPRPDILRDNPALTLDREQDAVALVFRNGMYRFNHPATPGTSLAERVPLLEWTEDVLADHLTLTEPYERSERIILPGLRALAKNTHADNQDPVVVLRKAIADAIGPVLGVDIFFDTRSTLDYARRELASLLGIDVPSATADDGTPTTITTEQLTIQLTVRPCGVLTADLQPDPAIKNRQDRLRTSVEARATEIAHVLEPVPYPTIALVEIPGKKHYERARRPLDPKFAVKFGLGRLGRLSQCVTKAELAQPNSGKDQPKSDPSREKLRQCWADLIRQLGVRTSPLPAPGAGGTIANPPAYLAVWVIRQNKQRHWGATRQVPVAVLISPDGARIQACAPDVPWAPLHQAQLRISSAHMISNQRRDAADITRFVERVLREAAAVYPDTVLLTDAHNLRTGWTYLLHHNFKPDHLGFGPTIRHIRGYPGLRHVRVRRGTDNEVPHGFAFNETEESSTYDGLWIGRNDRTFLSTGDKPVSASKAARYASKITTFLNRKKQLKEPSPGAYVWNARPCEITAAATQENDDPQDWAVLVHELRWATTNYNYATANPWPLRVAEKIGEYVLPVELLDEITDQAAESSEGPC
ncbi:Uncharacterised protein [Nocardia otitidiscaviarum]|uniref:DUF3893 domain-containing protein n=1 Tax=Nocardia otitidiscaviarum TaxID=1823 RepID=A0A378Y6L2_9NOCA|nr:DUF3962 domain-containing protein [Nocardia otitidiscaviarum]SUA72855.1 Uncharacterised protein [Nocardia otitidiscaviarum]